MKMTRILTAMALGAAMCLTGTQAQARDHIKIVGSSTVYPYAQAVAEEFANKTGENAPVLESTGTGGGIKIFCQGIGEAYPDFTNASRAMKESEWKLCHDHGVTSVTEVLIGYDGLSIAVSRNGKPLDLSKEQIFMALATEVPVDGKLVKNPHTKWSDIDAALPATKITVYGPPPTSGTRDAFVELAMHEGCEHLPFFKAKKDALGDKSAFKAFVKENCSRMRQDGAFIEAGENDNLIVQRLEADPDAYGIFGYSFLYENTDKLMPIKVGGVEPDMDTIADGSYGISRPLYFYIKNAHRNVISGMTEYIEEFVSEEALAPDGYLAERGLVSLPDEQREQVRNAANSATELTRFSN